MEKSMRQWKSLLRTYSGVDHLGAGEARQVCAAAEAFLAHDLAGVGRVDHRVVAGDDADVARGGHRFSGGQLACCMTWGNTARAGVSRWSSVGAVLVAGSCSC